MDIPSSIDVVSSSRSLATCCLRGDESRRRWSSEPSPVRWAPIFPDRNLNFASSSLTAAMMLSFRSSSCMSRQAEAMPLKPPKHCATRSVIELGAICISPASPALFLWSSCFEGPRWTLRRKERPAVTPFTAHKDSPRRIMSYVELTPALYSVR